MPERRNGETRTDDLNIDALLPDLTDLDPTLGDLLDLSGPPPEPLPLRERSPQPLPREEPTPPAVEAGPAEQPPVPPAPVVSEPWDEAWNAIALGPVESAPSSSADDTTTEHPIATESWAVIETPAPLIVPDDVEPGDEAAAPEPAPHLEPEPPRMPVVPVGEDDGFGAQVAAAIAPEGAGAEALERGASGTFAVRTDPVAPPPPAPITPPPEAVPFSEPEPRGPDAIVVAVASAEPTPATTADTEAPTAAEVAAVPAPVGAVASPCVEPTPVTVKRTSGLWRRNAVRAVTVVVTVAAVAALLLTNSRSDDGGSGATASEPTEHLVAAAEVPIIDVYAAPDDPQPEQSLDHPTALGGALVFLVTDGEEGDEWLEVLLPTEPAGRTGWVRRADVTLSKHEYEVVIGLDDKRLALFEGGEQKLAVSVAIGTRDAPKPGDGYYITELIEPPNTDTVYGDFAYGLSGHANELTSFSAGEGVVGIHGTNDPSVIGQEVSTGSIRMTNEDIRKLVDTLPLGTPVEVRP